MAFDVRCIDLCILTNYNLSIDVDMIENVRGQVYQRDYYIDSC